jgi:hypothetical protein
MNTNMESESTQLLKSPKLSGSQATLDMSYQNTLNHLVLLCSQKGSKEYGWARTKELDAHPSGLWRGIADDLVKHMKETNAKSKE